MTLHSRSGPALVLALVVLALPHGAAAAPGDIDAGFASAGVYTGLFQTTFSGDDAQQVAVDSLGRVYLAATLEGIPGGGSPQKVNVQRLTAQGTLDSGYGAGGTATMPFPADTYLAGLAIDGQDRVVVAGVNDIAGGAKLALGRLTSTGQPDGDLSGDGWLVTALAGASAAVADGVAIGPADSLLVGSTVVIGGVARGAVSRFTAAGVLDAGYGVAGTRTFGAAGQRVSAIVALAGGGVFAAGRRDYISWGIAKLDAAGGLDSTFDGDGLAETDLGKAALDLIEPFAIGIDGQGRAVVAGQFTGGGDAFAVVARFTAGGALDPSFGTGTPTAGAMFVSGVGGARIRGLLICDSRILVAGGARRPPPQATTNSHFVAAIGPGGALDPAFAPAAATPGVSRLELGQYNTLTDIARAGGGVIVAGFRRTQPPLEDYPVLVRLRDACGSPAAGGPPAPPPAQGPPAAPGPAPGVSLTVASVVRFPSTRACVSRRAFAIRLRVPPGGAVTEASVLVKGRRAAVRRGVRLRSTVDLRSLPKGRFRVEVRLRLADGRTIKETRRYRTCAPKRRPARP